MTVLMCLFAGVTVGCKDVVATAPLRDDRTDSETAAAAVVASDSIIRSIAITVAPTSLTVGQTATVTVTGLVDITTTSSKPLRSSSRTRMQPSTGTSSTTTTASTSTQTVDLTLRAVITASAGSVMGSIYTAPSTGGAYTLRAVIPNTSVSSSTIVTVVGPLPSGNSFVVFPSEIALIPGRSAKLSAVLQTPAGVETAASAVVWRVGDSSIATVDGTGLVLAGNLGTTQVFAIRGTDTSAVTVSVQSSVGISFILLWPRAQTILRTGKAGVTATAYDVGGMPVASAFSWTTGPAAIVHSSTNLRNNASRLIVPATVGSATVSASVGGRQATAVIRIVDSQAAVSSRCNNEPLGLTAYTNQQFNSLPTATPVNGWSYSAKTGDAVIGSDPTAPASAPSIAVGRYPTTMNGGASPFVMTFDIPSASGRPTTLYQCVFVKQAADWTDGGNSGTKFSFFRGDGTNHYWGFDGDLQDYNRLMMGFQYSGTLPTSAIYTNHFALPTNRWRKYEVLAVGNSAGVSDGSIKMWVDDVLYQSTSGVQIFPPGRTPGFSAVAWDGTYGGGTKSPPRNLSVSVDNWYISGSR